MAKHLGKNLRNIRLLKGMKQETFARKMGIAQQNISKMEKKAKVSHKKLEEAAKILGVTVETIKKFNEKAVFNSNIAFEQNSGQTNNVGSTKEIIEYFKGELAKKDKEIKELRRTIEAHGKDEHSGAQLKTREDNDTRLAAVK